MRDFVLPSPSYELEILERKPENTYIWNALLSLVFQFSTVMLPCSNVQTYSGKFMESYTDEAKRTGLTWPYQNTQKVILYMGLGNHFPEKYA